MKHSASIPLTLVGVAALLKLDIPKTVEDFVANKVSGGNMHIPHNQPSGGQFVAWMGGFALLAIVLLAAEQTEYASAASALAWLVAIGALYSAGDKIGTTFGVGPTGADAPGSPYGGLSAAQKSNANPAATQRNRAGV